MAREIIEEKDLIRKLPVVYLKDVKDISTLLQSYDVVYITGSGTSYHASLLMNILLTKSGINSVLIPASEFNYWMPEESHKKSLVIIFSQSGESSDALSAMNRTLISGVDVLGITNETDSTLYAKSTYHFCTDAGHEHAITATKSYLSQVIFILMLYLNLNNISNNFADAAKEIAEIIDNSEGIENIVNKFRKNIIILGSEYLYPVAMEAALKLKEASNTVAEGYATREFLHGPKQILNDDFTIIVIGNGKTTIEDLNRYHSNIITISNSKDADFTINDESVSNIASYIIIIQIMAYYNAVRLNLDPDKPDKLSKVVK
jgi:glucosamine--fructose-6-phosphate aminotransferase (isomerizing)